MMGNKYIPLTIVAGGVVLGASLAYTLRQHDLLRLLILLSMAGMAVILMWQRE